MFDNDTLMFFLRKYEEKLKELMTEEELMKFTAEIAKEGFRREVESAPDGGFRQFCLDHFDEITGGHQ